MRDSNLMAKLGAASYVIWSLLHFQAAWAVYQLGKGMPPGMAAGQIGRAHV